MAAAPLAGHRLLHFRAIGGDGCAHEREVGEALGDEEDGEVGARGGVRGFAESRDVDGVPLVFLDLHGATDVDVESVVGAELDVLRLGRVAALDADRLAVAVVVDRLDVHAELDADALGVAAAAAAELPPLAPPRVTFLKVTHSTWSSARSRLNSCHMSSASSGTRRTWPPPPFVNDSSRIFIATCARGPPARGNV